MKSELNLALLKREFKRNKRNLACSSEVWVPKLTDKVSLA